MVKRSLDIESNVRQPFGQRTFGQLGNERLTIKKFIFLHLPIAFSTLLLNFVDIKHQILGIMAIKYEVQSIENSQGMGKSRQFIRLHQGRAMTADELADKIATSSTLTAADLKAVMSELCHYAKEELASGHRFYLPEIGYLSLSVSNTPPTEKSDDKLTGSDIYLRNIDFRPEAKFLNEIRRKVRFEKSKYSTLSKRYTEDELWQKTEAYLTENGYLTQSVMRSHFGLSKYMTAQWLTHFIAEGKLVKKGTPRLPLYFLS